jgi:hypothetical protein
MAIRANQQMQRNRQMQNALLLRTAAELAGSSEIVAGLEAVPSPNAVLVERLRALPEDKRKQLLERALAAAEAVVAFLYERSHLPGVTYVVLFCVLHPVMLFIDALREADTPELEGRALRPVHRSSAAWCDPSSNARRARPHPSALSDPIRLHIDRRARERSAEVGRQR